MISPIAPELDYYELRILGAYTGVDFGSNPEKSDLRTQAVRRLEGLGLVKQKDAFTPEIVGTKLGFDTARFYRARRTSDARNRKSHLQFSATSDTVCRRCNATVMEFETWFCGAKPGAINRGSE